MKPIVLHPGSLAMGVVLAGAWMLALSAQTPQVESTLHPAPRKVDLHIVGIPDPNDMVVEIVVGSGAGRAAGYLVDARP